MKLIAPVTEANQSRRYVEVEEGAAWVQDYFGRKTATEFTKGAPATQGMPCPQAFLVEQNPNQVAPPHFHLVDQFQLVVGGSGHLGKHRVGVNGIHYANAYTTYGPLAADAEGLHYLTLRNRWDCTQAHFMPKSRSVLKAEPRRHLLIDPTPPIAHLTGLMAVSCEALHAPEPDGLAIWRYRVPPNTSATGPDPRLGAGQYWVVQAGALASDDADLAPLSCLFLSPDEAPLAIEARGAGVELLALQFPIRSLH